jgi:hypothetical protein
MVVYDCDDDAQYTAVSERIESEDLLRRTLVSTFAPDTLAEARNRGFRAP